MNDLAQDCYFAPKDDALAASAARRFPLRFCHQALFMGCTIALLNLIPLRVIAQSSPPVRIPGTAVELAPPPGFQVSRQFSGFEDPQTRASIVVMEMPVPRAAAPTFLAGLTNGEQLRSQGMTLKDTQPITVGSLPGKLLLVSQGIAGTTYLKWIAVTAAGDHALLVTASFPADQATTLQEPLRQSLLRLTWQPDRPVPLLEGLPFTVQPAGDLQITDRIGNNLMLTRNGAKPPVPPSDPLLVVGSSYRAVLISDIASFSRQRLQTLPEVRALKEIEGQPKMIAGHTAFELTAEAYDLKTNLPLTVYQMIIYTGSTYYLVHGLIPQTEAAVYLPVFRAVANSLVPQP